MLPSDKYAVNYLQQVSRKAAGEIRWIEASGPSALHLGVNADLISEASLRKCVHVCGCIKEYVPNSGTLWGFCKRCNGYVCDKPSCQDCYPQEQFIEDVETIANHWGPSRKQIEALVRRQAWREKVFVR